MVSIEFGRSPLLGKHTDALPVPPASFDGKRGRKDKRERKRKKEREEGGEKRSRASEEIATERERSSVRNSILVKRGYKAETGVSSDRRNRYLFNTRRRKDKERKGGVGREERRVEAREKNTFHVGLRVPLGARKRDKKRSGEGNWRIKRVAK